jgi:hypothetical protein
MSNSETQNTHMQKDSNNENNAGSLPTPVVADLTSGAVFEVDFEHSGPENVRVWDGVKSWKIPRDFFAQMVQTGDFRVAENDAELRPPRR